MLSPTEALRDGTLTRLYLSHMFYFFCLKSPPLTKVRWSAIWIAGPMLLNRCAAHSRKGWESCWCGIGMQAEKLNSKWYSEIHTPCERWCFGCWDFFRPQSKTCNFSISSASRRPQRENVAFNLLQDSSILKTRRGVAGAKEMKYRKIRRKLPLFFLPTEVQRTSPTEIF